MARFRHVPVEVEAVQWTGSNWGEIVDAFAFRPGRLAHDPSSHSLLVYAPDGRMRCMAGDWVLCDQEGIFSVQRDEAFQVNYASIPDPPLGAEPTCCGG